MSQFSGFSAQGIAIANGVLITFLIDRLVEKGLLTDDDAAAVVTSARDSLLPDKNKIAVAEAVRLLEAKLS